MEKDDAPLVVPVLLDAGGALPAYASAGAAGADLRASEALEIAAGSRAAVATGVRLEIPPGHVGLVWPRSGLAVQTDPALANAQRGFLLVYLTSFNEWHEGHAFEPMADAASLRPALRAFGYHNPARGDYRLAALSALLHQLRERMSL